MVESPDENGPQTSPPPDALPTLAAAAPPMPLPPPPVSMPPVADRPAARLLRLEALAAGYRARALAANTRRAYRTNWQSWSDWCGALGFEPLAADPHQIGLHLADAADHLKPASLRLRLAAIAAGCRAADRPIDTRHRAIAAVLAGITRTQGSAQRQVAPALPALLAGMVARLPDNPIGMRDRAMLLLGFAAALRRSELVALDRADAQVLAEGLLVTVRFSKTDAAGLGETVAIARQAAAGCCPVAALEAWLAQCDRNGRCGRRGPVRPGRPGRPAAGRCDRCGRCGRCDRLFQHVDGVGAPNSRPLSDRYVARLVKRCAAAAGADPRQFSGHSLRAGLATAAGLDGAGLDAIMRQTRHRSVAAARRYLRAPELWRDNVTAGLLGRSGGSGGSATGGLGGLGTGPTGGDG